MFEQISSVCVGELLIDYMNLYVDTCLDVNSVSVSIALQLDLVPRLFPDLSS